MTLTEAKKLSASFKNRTKYPTPGRERLIKIDQTGNRIYLRNSAGSLKVITEHPAGIRTEFYHA